MKYLLHCYYCEYISEENESQSSEYGEND